METQLSRQAIEEFKAIYEQRFGEPLTDDEAQEMSLRVLRLFALLAGTRGRFDAASAGTV